MVVSTSKRVRPGREALNDRRRYGVCTGAVVACRDAPGARALAPDPPLEGAELEQFDSPLVILGAVAAGLALVAYVGYKIIKRTVMLAFAALLATAAAVGVGAYYIWG